LTLIGAARTFSYILNTPPGYDGLISTSEYFRKYSGIGDFVKQKYPISEKRLRGWKESLEKMLLKFEDRSRKKIDLFYQEILSQLQGAKDELSKEMSEQKCHFEKCVTELDERNQALKKIEDFFEQALPE